MAAWVTFSRLNNLLLGLIICINLYIIASPFSPAIVFWYQKSHDSARQQTLREAIVVSSKPSTALPSTSSGVSLTTNQLINPAILLDQTINEGSQTYTELAKGVWRWPGGSTPSQGGNTVLVGHRFTYTDPRGVFYELNQVKLGDTIGIIWDGTTYDYIVKSVSQVSPSQTAILDQSTQPEVTLYTCTPLFLPKYRLVVVAGLEAHS